jgi:amidohydrolase
VLPIICAAGKENTVEINELKNQVSQMQDEIIAWRRHFHKHAELSFEEYATTDYIEKQLLSFGGIEVSRPTETGVIGKITGGKPGKTIALRADIDALPLTEVNDFPFVSEKEGVMHACGHDGHTAILLGIAKLFCRYREEMSGTLICIFQPGEEKSPGGALVMVRAGVMNGIEEIYGLHLTSVFPTGTFGVRAGALTSATDRFSLTVNGRGGHSSMPEICIDPVVAGAQIITGLQSVISRQIRALDTAVLSICHVSSGESFNCIPDSMLLQGTVRTYSKELRSRMPHMIKQISEGIASAYGASCDLDYDFGCSSVTNDEVLTENTEKTLLSWFHSDSILHIDPIMPGEDFSAFTEETGCRGCFIEIGTADEELGTTVAHHNPAYMMDERGLFYGMCLFAGIVNDRLFA